jgi:hypothetical protein
MKGGIAGMIAKSAIAPIERIKITFQVKKEIFIGKWISLGAKYTIYIRGSLGTRQNDCSKCWIQRFMERKLSKSA